MSQNGPTPKNWLRGRGRRVRREPITTTHALVAKTTRDRVLSCRVTAVPRRRRYTHPTTGTRHSTVNDATVRCDAQSAGPFFPCRGLTRSAPQGRARAWVCSDDRGVGEQRAGCGAGRHVPDGYPGARRRSFTTGRRGTARSGPEGTVTRRRFWVSSIHSSSPNAGAELNFLSTFRASFGSSSESSSPRLARVSPSSRLRNEDGAGGRLPFWARTTKRFTNRFTGTEVVCPSAPSSSFCFTHRGRHATLTPRASPRSSLRAFP